MNVGFAGCQQKLRPKYSLIDGEDSTSFRDIVKQENEGGTGSHTKHLPTLDTAKETAMVEDLSNLTSV